MPRSFRLALALALALGGAGCKKQQQQQSTPGRQGRVDPPAPAVDPRMPAPHRLAAEPPAGAYVAEPAALLAAAAAYSPEVPGLAEAAEQVLATQGPAAWAKAMAPQLAGDRPWAAVHVAGEDVLHLPLQPAAVARAQALLAGYAKEGSFGAVKLPAAGLELRNSRLGPPERPLAPKLAYIDAAAGTLTLAGTLQGIATGRELPRQYGQRPVWFTLDHARGEWMLAKFPYGRVGGGGQGLHELDVVAAAKPGQELPVMRDVAPGALPGLLASPSLVAGGSTRWTGYKEAVREAIHQMQANVDRAGFAGKMMLDPIVDQATRVLKAWNGRVMLGVGPARHVRVGLGADDPNAAMRQATTLVRDITENLQLARMFVSNVPNASLKKVADDPDIYLLTVSGVAGLLPAAVRTLAEDGRLRVAFAGSAHCGGLLAVVGPRADAEMKAWLAQAIAAPPGKDGMKDLVAASLAASPEALAPLLSATRVEDAVGAALALSADRPPTQLVFRQDGARYLISVRGPKR